MSDLSNKFSPFDPYSNHQLSVWFRFCFIWTVKKYAIYFYFYFLHEYKHVDCTRKQTGHIPSEHVSEYQNDDEQWKFFISWARHHKHSNRMLKIVTTPDFMPESVSYSLQKQR